MSNEANQFKKFSVGFRVSPEMMESLRNPAPYVKPSLARRLWDGIKWRIKHAWMALIYGDCEYF